MEDAGIYAGEIAGTGNFDIVSLAECQRKRNDSEESVRQGIHPESTGKHPEGTGEHPESIGKHLESTGEHPESIRKYPEGTGEYPGNIRKTS